jgi:hypothetical protein
MNTRHHTSIIVVTALFVCFIFSACSKKPDTPVEAYKQVEQACQQKNWGAVWDACEESTRQTVGAGLALGLAFMSMQDKNMEQAVEKELAGMKEKEKLDKPSFIKLFALYDKYSKEEDGSIISPSVDIVEKHRTENKALLVATKKNGKKENVQMILQDGEWKLYAEMK